METYLTYLSIHLLVLMIVLGRGAAKIFRFGEKENNSILSKFSDKERQ
jgi:hypothetical protein